LSIDFFDADAVKMLNRALLKHFYKINYWNIPQNYLCPPIPGRADYMHYAADLLASSNHNKIPIGNKVRCLDVGVGANCIYPLIGNKEYEWNFVGSDIDDLALRSADRIVENNSLNNKIELRLQRNESKILDGIIQSNEYFDLIICNPPFHASAKEAHAAAVRKQSNLNQRRINTPILNFGGQSNELWRRGGEEKFVKDMINESVHFANQCLWFTTLISKQAALKSVYGALDQVEVEEVKTIQMGQGNKVSRLVAWTYLTKEDQADWAKDRW
jgi:23S rRNA (adenine1618-N6)-methyltransferase